MHERVTRNGRAQSGAGIMQGMWGSMTRKCWGQKTTWGSLSFHPMGSGNQTEVTIPAIRTHVHTLSHNAGLKNSNLWTTRLYSMLIHEPGSVLSLRSCHLYDANIVTSSFSKIVFATKKSNFWTQVYDFEQDDHHSVAAPENGNSTISILRH